MRNRVYLGAGHHRRPRNAQAWVDGGTSSDTESQPGYPFEYTAPMSVAYYPPGGGAPVTANFLFWGISDGTTGRTQASRMLTQPVANSPLTLIAWYYLPASGGNGPGGSAILIDAYSALRGDFVDEDFVDVTSDATLTASANVDGVVPTAVAEQLDAYNGISTGEAFSEWAFSGHDMAAVVDDLDAGAGAEGLAIATYVPTTPWVAHIPTLGWTILFGVAQDGGGAVVHIGTGGPPVPVDPWGPLIQRMLVAASLDARGSGLSKKAAKDIHHAASSEIADAARAIAKLAQAESK
jgi:hypothetical protein